MSDFRLQGYSSDVRFGHRRDWIHRSVCQGNHDSMTALGSLTSKPEIWEGYPRKWVVVLFGRNFNPAFRIIKALTLGFKPPLKHWHPTSEPFGSEPGPSGKAGSNRRGTGRFCFLVLPLHQVWPRLSGDYFLFSPFWRGCFKNQPPNKGCPFCPWPLMVWVHTNPHCTVVGSILRSLARRVGANRTIPCLPAIDGLNDFRVSRHRVLIPGSQLGDALKAYWSKGNLMAKELS